MCVVPTLLIALALAAPASAQSPSTAPPATPELDQIVAQLARQNQDRLAHLRHYEGCREYQVDYAGFPTSKSANMVVQMEYTAPAEKVFRIVREQGAHLLVNKVLKELLANEKEATNEQQRKATALTTDNYEFHFVGTDTRAGRLQYVLAVTPRIRSKYLYEGRIWVDATDFAVTRISAEPAKNPSFWITHTSIEHEYTKVGEFWLPAHNVSVSKVRLGGTATLNIRYVNYTVGDATHNNADACTDLPRAVQVSATH